MRALILFAALWTSAQGLTCVNPDGNEVDWFSVYKTPKEHGNPDWRFKDGLALYYLDVNAPTWKVSTHAANETKQAIYNTLQQVYEAKDGDILYRMYNDESPPSPSSIFSDMRSRGGHTKGVVAFDGTSGFWLIHSTPKFPPRKSDGYNWPHGAEDYGQTFLCVSFPYSEWDSIATQLTYNQPNIYDQGNMSSPLYILPALHKPGPPWFNVAKLTSLNGQEFTSFAKSSKFGKDLYHELVAPRLEQDLLVETWLRPKGTELNTNCSGQYKVYRIQAINLPGGDQFSETKDHAKWAVSVPSGHHHLAFRSEQVLRDVKSSNDYWTCIGDINRMVSQFKRGGGTMCLQNSDVWKSYQSTVQKYQQCS